MAVTALGAVVLAALPSSAQTPPDAGRPIGPLTGFRPPAPPQQAYAAIVKDSAALVALGKALFWDVQVGGANDQACASCHFHAGADTRTFNQLSPGLLVEPSPDSSFGDAQGKMGSGSTAGPNIALSAADFPFHKLADVNNRESAVTYDSNDAVSSQGSFEGLPLGVNGNNPVGQRTRCGTAGAGAPFAIGAGGGQVNTRKVPPRNSPTAINSVFYQRHFWDGRANNVFNGVDTFGRRAIAADPAARVFTTDGGTVTPQALTLENMAAASQAVGPVLSDVEMTCQGKVFADIGRRLMQQRALKDQAIAADDSVFSKTPNLRIMPSGGVSANYRELVRTAFQPAYWQSERFWTVDRGTGRVSQGGGAVNGYQVDELNFALFFGLAIDAYERTLISDQAPFDTGAMSDQARAGQAVFQGQGKCAGCHDGPLFSSATTWQGDSDFLPVERMPMADPAPALYDSGFYNIGVRPTHEDVGLGGADPYGNPLSFTRQFVQGPGNNNIGVDRFSMDACKLEVPFDSGNCSAVPNAAEARSLRVAVDGAFKTPTLRNVGLTAPYFHNGGQKSLAEVVAFYNRGGDRRSVSGGDTTGTGPLGRPVVNSGDSPTSPNMGGSNADPDVTTLGLNAQQQTQLVEFLKALTDRRVACHAAPFDHPALTIPNGHQARDANRDGNADDTPLAIRAVGAGGYANCDRELPALNSGELFTSSPAFERVAK
jgi:cytochrome c peroxidase